MENCLGLLRIHVLRGVNLAIRDSKTIDSYVLFKMGKQKFKTRVMKRDLNSEWNDFLTFSISYPNTPIKLLRRQNGDAEFEIGPFLNALKMNLKGIKDGTIISKVEPNRQNCIAEMSNIFVSNGKVVQDMVLRLRNVECGEVELQLQWIDVPASK